ncbi:MAG: hypothetical protein ACNS63_05975 [Candidatus Nitrospinota bacterium M3_3B_026]
MMKALTWEKILILAALLLAPLALAGCGESEGESVAAASSGVKGPSYPSGYHMELIVTPYSTISNSTVNVTVKVWDSNGNPAGGVAVMVGGDESADDDNFGTTGSNGEARWSWEIKAPAGAVLPITATVESMSATVMVQVVSAAGAEA